MYCTKGDIRLVGGNNPNERNIQACRGGMWDLYALIAGIPQQTQLHWDITLIKTVSVMSIIIFQLFFI